MRATRNWALAAGLLALPLCFASPLPAFGAGIASVAVGHTGTDPVGKNLDSALKEAIRASAVFTLGQMEKAQFEISLVTLDAESEAARGGDWTVAAIVYLARTAGGVPGLKPQAGYPFFLAGSVFRVGKYKVDEAALRILANLEAEIKRFRGEPKQPEEAAPAEETELPKRPGTSVEAAPAIEDVPSELEAPAGGVTPAEGEAPLGEQAPTGAYK